MSSSSEKSKMLAGEFYQGWDKVLTKERLRARQLCRKYNTTTEDQRAVRDSILTQLLGSKVGAINIEPSFQCDYGYNIYLGENFYSNFGLIVLDVCEVRIGKNCMIGPRVSICTATHPIDAKTRISGMEFGKPITIGDNVWIGAHAVINPGVRLGDNVVVASGAVVAKSFEDNVVIAGMPAKVLSRLQSDTYPDILEPKI
jgi:maltose O-acetyltransferase